MTPEMLMLAFYVIAVAASAMSGALAAGRRSMDWVGVLIIAAVTGVGGGSMRDVLLGHYPLYWVKHVWVLGVVAGAAFLTIVFARFVHRLKRAYIVLDAIGLVVVTIVGCDVALQDGHHVVIVVLAGVLTGCIGGVLRDVLCNQVPLLFSSELYASVSVLTGSMYVGGLALGLDHDAVAFAAVASGLTLRLLAVRFHWGMPKFIYTKDW